MDDDMRSEQRLYWMHWQQTLRGRRHPMTFVQIIQYETTRPAEMEAAFEEWLRATEGTRTACRELHTQDRDNPARFVDIVEFPSYEEAMVNNELPATQRIATRIRELCTGEPQYLNLKVLRQEDL
jgi:hypothetical protein